MEDRFKFRAKRKDNGELVYGDFATLPCGISQSGYTDEFSDFGDYIITSKTKQSSYYSNSNPMEVCYCEYCLIDAETLQQSTGLKDKNGKLIYEGDILITSEHNLCKENEKYKVFWHKEYCQFLFESINNGYCIDFMDMYKPDVIGNIYEHKDLLNA